jgi:hypothetical protein
VNLSCNNLYLNYNIWYCILMCVDCVLTLLRIAQADPGQQTFSPRWFCHRTRSGKGVYDDAPESSTRHCGAFHPPVPPLSPLTPPVSLKHLLALQNAIMERLAKINNRSNNKSLKNPPTSTSWQPNLQSSLR